MKLEPKFLFDCSRKRLMRKTNLTELTLIA